MSSQAGESRLRRGTVDGCDATVRMAAMRRLSTLFELGKNDSHGDVKAEVASRTAASSEPWLVKHPAEWRQIGIVAAYLR